MLSLNRFTSSQLFVRILFSWAMCSILCALSFSAKSLEVGNSLPELTIDNSGEITVVNGKAKYRPWSSSQIDKITLLQIMRASNESQEVNQSFLDKFSAAFEENSSVDSTTVIISRSIPRLFGGFVKKELKKNKIAHPRAVMVNDKRAKALETWGIPDTLSVMLLVNSEGKVLTYHEGRLPLEQEDRWIETINQWLKEA